MTLQYKTNTQSWRSANSASIGSATRTRKIGGAAMTKPKQAKNQGAGVMPNIARSRSSYPQAIITLKTLGLLENRTILKA
jgi:hypothetical protein